MKKDKNATKKIRFAAELAGSNWVPDKYGNFKKTIGSIEYRIKIENISIRVEKKLSTGAWKSIAGGKTLYYVNYDGIGEIFEELNLRS